MKLTKLLTWMYAFIALAAYLTQQSPENWKARQRL